MPETDPEAVDVVAGQDPKDGETEESPGKIKKARRKKHQMLPPGQGRFLTREKERKALELRKGGASYASIAQAVGYRDQSSARKAVLRAFGQVIQEPVEELRGLQVERLNHMLLTLWPKVQAGDERAIMTALSVMDRINALAGTEAAQKVDITATHQHAVLVVDGDKDAYLSSLKRMAGMVDANGHNKPREIQGRGTPEPDVIDAEVEDEPEPVPARVQVAEPQAEQRVKVPVYNFGVDPVTARKGVPGLR